MNQQDKLEVTMNEKSTFNDSNIKSLNKKIHDIWNKNAYFWDEKMGEGNQFHKILLEPTQERLLELKPEEVVLDIACGNGQFARKMAQSGTRIVAFDFSEKFIERAKYRTKENVDRIEYMVIDATNRSQLLTLGKHRFDAAVCTMALMDMSNIETLISSLSQLLKTSGRFVFSVMHPCFNSIGSVQMKERIERRGKIIDIYSIKVSEYIHPKKEKGIGIVGQPVPQYYFHRPISIILNTCFDAGFVLDGIEEPVFGDLQKKELTLHDMIFKQIPPALVCRMRTVK